MSVLRQRTSQRTKKLLMAGGIGALVMGILSSGIFIYSLNSVKNNEMEAEAQYQQTINNDQNALQKEHASEVKVYEMNQDITAGSLIQASDLTQMLLPKASIPGNVVTNIADVAGKYAKIDIQKNTPMIKSMVYDEGVTPADMRLQEFKVISLPEHLKKDDYVDVRIKFPTGQDFIVLSKKKVKDLQQNTIWFGMDEKEMLLMSSAVIDAYMQNAIIYAVAYVDPMQAKADVNYPVNLKVQNLILSDPNVVAQAKQGLESFERTNLDSGLQELTSADKQKFMNSQIYQQLQEAESSGTTTGTNGSNSNSGSSSSDNGATSKDTQKQIINNNAGNPISAFGSR